MAGFDKAMRELARMLPPGVLRWNRALEAWVVYTVSRVDRRRYVVVMYEGDCSERKCPPRVFVYPYPGYVKKGKEFERNHVRSCCFERSIESGSICFFHIDRGSWDRFRSGRKMVEAVYMVLENVLQGLHLEPMQVL